MELIFVACALGLLLLFLLHSARVGVDVTPLVTRWCCGKAAPHGTARSVVGVALSAGGLRVDRVHVSLLPGRSSSLGLGMGAEEKDAHATMLAALRTLLTSAPMLALALRLALACLSCYVWVAGAGPTMRVQSLTVGHGGPPHALQLTAEGCVVEVGVVSGSLTLALVVRGGMRVTWCGAGQEGGESTSQEEEGAQEWGGTARVGPDGGGPALHLSLEMPLTCLLPPSVEEGAPKCTRAEEGEVTRCGAHLHVACGKVTLHAADCATLLALPSLLLRLVLRCTSPSNEDVWVDVQREGAALVHFGGDKRRTRELHPALLAGYAQAARVVGEAWKTWVQPALLHLLPPTLHTTRVPTTWQVSGRVHEVSVGAPLSGGTTLDLLAHVCTAGGVVHVRGAVRSSSASTPPPAWSTTTVEGLRVDAEALHVGLSTATTSFTAALHVLTVRPSSDCPSPWVTGLALTIPVGVEEEEGRQADLTREGRHVAVGIQCAHVTLAAVEGQDVVLLSCCPPPVRVGVSTWAAHSPLPAGVREGGGSVHAVCAGAVTLTASLDGLLQARALVHEVHAACVGLALPWFREEEEEEGGRGRAVRDGPPLICTLEAYSCALSLTPPPGPQPRHTHLFSPYLAHAGSVDCAVEGVAGWLCCPGVAGGAGWPQDGEDGGPPPTPAPPPTSSSTWRVCAERAGGYAHGHDVGILARGCHLSGGPLGGKEGGAPTPPCACEVECTRLVASLFRRGNAAEALTCRCHLSSLSPTVPVLPECFLCHAHQVNILDFMVMGERGPGSDAAVAAHASALPHPSVKDAGHWPPTGAARVPFSCVVDGLHGRVEGGAETAHLQAASVGCVLAVEAAPLLVGACLALHSAARAAQGARSPSTFSLHTRKPVPDLASAVIEEHFACPPPASPSPHDGWEPSSHEGGVLDERVLTGPADQATGWSGGHTRWTASTRVFTLTVKDRGVGEPACSPGALLPPRSATTSRSGGGRSAVHAMSRERVQPAHRRVPLPPSPASSTTTTTTTGSEGGGPPSKPNRLGGEEAGARRGRSHTGTRAPPARPPGAFILTAGDILCRATHFLPHPEGGGGGTRGGACHATRVLEPYPNVTRFTTSVRTVTVQEHLAAPGAYAEPGWALYWDPSGHVTLLSISGLREEGRAEASVGASTLSPTLPHTSRTASTSSLPSGVLSSESSTPPLRASRASPLHPSHPSSWGSVSSTTAVGEGHSTQASPPTSALFLEVVGEMWCLPPPPTALPSWIETPAPSPPQECLGRQVQADLANPAVTFTWPMPDAPPPKALVERLARLRECGRGGGGEGPTPSPLSLPSRGGSLGGPLHLGHTDDLHKCTLGVGDLRVHLRGRAVAWARAVWEGEEVERILSILAQYSARGESASQVRCRTRPPSPPPSPSVAADEGCSSREEPDSSVWESWTELGGEGGLPMYGGGEGGGSPPRLTPPPPHLASLHLLLGPRATPLLRYGRDMREARGGRGGRGGLHSSLTLDFDPEGSVTRLPVTIGRAAAAWAGASGGMDAILMLLDTASAAMPGVRLVDWLPPEAVAGVVSAVAAATALLHHGLPQPSISVQLYPTRDLRLSLPSTLAVTYPAGWGPGLASIAAHVHAHSNDLLVLAAAAPAAHLAVHPGIRAAGSHVRAQAALGVRTARQGATTLAQSASSVSRHVTALAGQAQPAVDVAAATLHASAAGAASVVAHIGHGRDVTMRRLASLSGGAPGVSVTAQSVAAGAVAAAGRSLSAACARLPALRGWAPFRPPPVKEGATRPCAAEDVQWVDDVQWVVLGVSARGGVRGTRGRTAGVRRAGSGSHAGASTGGATSGRGDAGRAALPAHPPGTRGHAGAAPPVQGVGREDMDERAEAFV